MRIHRFQSAPWMRLRWSLAIPLAAATLAVSLSCGGDATAPAPPPPPPPPPPVPQPTTVSVTPADVRLTVGDSAQLAAEVRDQNGQVMTGATVAWASNDVAVASVTSAGLVRGAGAGSATITATAGQASGNAAVTVSPPPPQPTTVSVTPSEVGLAVGDSAQLAAEVRDQDGQVMTGVAVAWASSDTAVASITSAGLVRGISAGAATIAATAGQASGNAEVTVSTPGPRDDRAALVALYEATNGPGWKERTNWLTDAPLGQWHGVTTDGDGDGDGAVIYLRLYDNGLAGTIPPELGYLANINQLSLGNNQLSGPIPPELGNLANINYLYLDDNQLAGTIPPELGNLANLNELALSGNDLSGPIPPELGNLANLSNGLALGGNDLSGPIPPELGNLANLATLYVGGNDLSGPIPPELGDLASLSELVLSGNDLSGSIPATLLRLDKLERFWFDDNAGLCAPGTAAFAAWLASISDASRGYCNGQDRAALEALYRSAGGANWSNSDGWLAEGPVLGEWHGISADSIGRVVGIDLAGNGLAGRLPTGLGQLTELRELRIGNNSQLTGPLPASLTSLALTDLHYAGTGLCAVDTRRFRDWLATITSHEGTGSECANDRDALAALYRATGGAGWNNNTNWLTDEDVGEWHGIGADSLGRAVRIDLDGNGLAGRLPAELGQLTELRELRIGNNSRLTGPLPASLTSLALTDLHYAGTGLCAVDTQRFRDWLATITSHEGTGSECTYADDREVLAALYRATGGAGWRNSANWLTDEALGEWHGIGADSLGRVVRIDLDDNGLAGRLPAGLGQLTELRVLRVGNNSQLTGPLPASLTSLALTDLHYAGTGLCSVDTPSFRFWVAQLTSFEGTGMDCAQVDRDALAALYRATGGAGWSNSANWLTDASLEQWHGVTTDSGGLVVELDLGGNDLAGQLPPELGGLANLERLHLYNNSLSGPIPPELGDLANLASIALHGNRLSGNIPPELGNLANLAYLYLESNQLSGTIPPELGNLANLELLFLSSNRLSGNIPPELGNLANLVHMRLDSNRLSGTIPSELGNLLVTALRLHGNRLTGAIPPELGGLANLTELTLTNNNLDGQVPAEFGKLAKLEKFSVSNNREMAGALPASLTGLTMLTEFLAGGTALCAPADPAFLVWLDGIRHWRVLRCAGGGGSAAAYLTQAVQSLAHPVPLVAGEPALLRVFVWVSGATGQRMPPVRARFYLDGSEVHVANIAAPIAPIPTSLDEGDLEASANASIPASVVQPALEMVVEIDPDGTLDASLDITRRIPAEGRAAVPVRAVPDFDLTIVPFLWRENPDRGIVRFTTDLTADDPRAFGLVNVLLPVRDIDLKIHGTVVTGNNSAGTLLEETEAIRTLEGAASDAYYMGMMSGEVAGAFAGIAHAPGRVSFSIPDSLVIAHELGHNLSLEHAPCGGAARPDPNFPTPDGTTGAWGFDMSGDSLVAPTTFDLLAYCDPVWISDYYFTKTLRYRVDEEVGGAAAAVAAEPEKTLLLWGGVGEDGEPFLEPAFIADAPPSLPLSPGGEYRVAGHDASGRELFSLGFDMPVLSHGDGRSAFAVALPARQEWAGSLAAITLSGPGGSFTLDESSDRAAAILRDPLTGQVRGIFRDAPPSLMGAAAMAAPLGPEAAAALSLPPGLEVLASRGIPRPEDWRR